MRHRLGYKKLNRTSEHRKALIKNMLNNLIKNRLVDDLYIFNTNLNLKKKGKNNTTLKYLKSISSKPISINLDNDKLYKKEF